VTCIKGKKSLSKDIFYTGLFNGKLTEWEIDTNFEINEIKNIYSHQASITVIELYDKQNIIITASEDKYIHIRKQYDFELLTVINLTYCFANPIVSQCSNIFPSLIKISDLNLLYVLIYDLNSKNNFIRGYNLNGLFFAQNEKEFFCDYEGNNLIINNISFTKNSNLIIGFYNLNKYCLLQAWDLKPNFGLKNFKENEKKERFGTQMVEYDYYTEKFYILYDNDFVVIPSKEIDI
jgi:WD40 repeat protein